MKIQIIRHRSRDKQTLGNGFVINDQGQIVFAFKTLELPWLENKRKVSCIPKGVYNTVKRTSPKYGSHFHLQDVPGRTWILIHHGNYYRDTLGCILPGRTHADIDSDGYSDVTHSKQTMQKLNELLPESFKTVIL
jgi:hypothetical protein